MAKALEYSNTSKAIQQHVDKEDKGTLPIRETAYETRAIFINESGLYALVLSSYSQAFPAGTPINVNKKKQPP